MSASAFSHINTSRCADVIHCISAAIHPDHATASQYIRRFFSEKQFDRIPKESSYEIFRRSHSFSEWHDHWAYRLQPVHSLRTGLEAQSFTGESVIHNSDLLRQKTHHGEKLVIERISPEQSSRNNQYAISSTRFSSAALLRKSRIRTALRSEAKQRDRISLYRFIPASSAFPEEKYLSGNAQKFFSRLKWIGNWWARRPSKFAWFFAFYLPFRIPAPVNPTLTRERIAL